MSQINSAIGAPVGSNSDIILAQWKDASTKLKALVLEEKSLRQQVVDAFSKETNVLASGVENIDVGWGHTLKVTHKLDHKLDATDDCKKLDGVLDFIERNTEGGKIIAERLVKWKPEISVTEYKLLTPANKAKIDTVLTTKAASKSVELVAKPAK